MSEAESLTPKSALAPWHDRRFEPKSVIPESEPLRGLTPEPLRGLTPELA